MKTEVSFILIIAVCLANGYVIIGPETYRTSPSRAYLSPIPQPSRAYLPAPIAPVRRISTVTHEVPFNAKTVHSDETVIAGPSGVIKTEKVASKPAFTTQTRTVTNVVHPQPVAYLAPPVVHVQQPLPLNPYYQALQYQPEPYVLSV